ncbi:g-protein alpha subunit domain-containing protein [Ditylenchus destructor]|uniref:G-protein alpha subunit domain-containing protein n=1 Tax=Ditylenchus destructor TaxID=166010 RepID=A0AAD4NDD0_9BILA|nr:g-protein alpha subunit domain-containing protein [Ditylenchus destructor]
MGQVCGRVDNSSKVHSLENKRDKNAQAVSPAGENASEKDSNDYNQNNLTTLRICLLGNSESGKTTVLEQIRKISKMPPPSMELELRKAFIYDNVVNSMRKILQYMEKMDAKVSDEKNNEHVELLMAHERTHGNPLSEKEIAALQALWKDKTVVEFYRRRGEYSLNDSTKYFMDSLPRIQKDSFQPTHDDLVMAYIPTVGVQNRLFEIGGSKINDRRYEGVYEGLDAIIFTLAISSYDQKFREDNDETEFEYSLKLLEKVCVEKRFNQTPVYVFLNETDVFKEKIKRAPLKNFFSDYKGNSEKDALHFIRDFCKTHCNECASRIDRTAPIEFRFTTAIDTSLMSKLLAEVLGKVADIRKD